MPTQNKYPVFEDNQVLTATQLNDLTAYLDEQTRISRTHLTGTGIVCGLETVLNKPGSSIKISGGTAITSEGFLICIGDCELTKYKEYNLAEKNLKYQRFMDNENVQDVALFELLPSSVPSSASVKAISTIPGAIDNYVVVLFLEIIDKDLASCLGKSCDEIGIDRIFTLRKLLVPKSDVDKINNKPGKAGALLNPNNQAAKFLDQYSLKHIDMPRPMLNSSNTTNMLELVFEYLKPISFVWENLIENSSNAYNAFELLLKKDFGSNPFGNASMVSKLSELKGLFNEYLQGKKGFQYYYDFVTDLVRAYNEFRCAASHLMNECCPIENLFPMHIMAGPIDCPPSTYRQHFVSSPVLNEQWEWKQKSIMLYKRLIAMIYAFEADIEKTSEKAILFTPSKEKGTRLGLRSIPIYYDVEASNPYSILLEDVWNEDQCPACTMPPSKVTGYHNQIKSSEQSYPLTKVETPLFYDTLDYPFFRIEGHIGMKLADAMAQAEEDIKRFNLDINLASISVGYSNKIEGITCKFADLETDYAIWRNKMRFFLTNLLELLDKLQNVSNVKNSAADHFSSFFNSKSNNQPADKIWEDASNSKKNGGRKAAYFFEKSNTFRVKNDYDKTTDDEEEIQTKAGRITNCIKELIASMPVDLEQFDFAKWCDAYRCSLNKYVDMMKFIGGRLNTLSSASMQIKYFIALNIMCYMHRGLNFIMIYPYLTIATISDTNRRRMQALMRKQNLSDWINNKPGIEHWGGSMRGNTFVMVTPGKPTRSEIDYSKVPPNATDLLNQLVNEFQKVSSLGEIENITKNLEGLVVADFVTNSSTCCDCEVDIDNFNLTPIAMPVTRILILEKGKLNEVKIQLLNNVYNPDAYEPDANSAKYGKIKFEEKDYLPEDDKVSKVLVYTIDPKKLRKAKKAVLIDEITYFFRDTDTGAKVSTSKIYIFISTGVSAKKTASNKGKVEGFITIKNASGATGIPKSEQIVYTQDGSETDLTVNSDGAYSVELDEGSHQLEIAIRGFESQSKNITVTSDQTSIADFTFDKSVGVPKGILDLASYKLENEVVEADSLIDSYKASAAELEKELNDKKNQFTDPVPDEVAASNKLTYDMLYTKEYEAKSLDSDYAKAIDELKTRYEVANEIEKSQIADAMATMTKAYVLRAGVDQPDGMTKDTKKVLDNTTIIMENIDQIEMKDLVNDVSNNATGLFTQKFKVSMIGLKI